MQKNKKNVPLPLDNWGGLLLVISLVLSLILAQRYLGKFQETEWKTLNWLFTKRAAETPDERMVIVGLEERDLQKFETYDEVISDRVLAQLLKKVKNARPRVIGLDLFRDKPVGQGNDELSQVFQSTPNLYGIEKVLGEQVASNSVLDKLGRSSASDVIVDSDRILRRTVLYPLTKENLSLRGFGLELAIAYLKKEKISPAFSQQGWLQLGGIEFPPFESNDGGYQNADAGSYQTLINYRNASFKRFSFSDVLEGRVAPNQLKDRIVLIGATAQSKKDFFYTPYSQQGKIARPLFGVEIQAHIVSQILSAVLDNRPLIRVWSEPIENLWILSWIIVPASLTWQLRRVENAGIVLALVIGGTIIGAGFLLVATTWAFQQGWWIPFSPAISGLILSTGVVTLYLYTAQHIQYHFHLKKLVKLRTQELESKNQELSIKNQQLQATQAQLIAEKKLATLGEIILGVAHEIKNPLNLIGNFTDLSFDLEQELQDLLENQAEYLEPDSFIKINEALLEIFQNLQIIKQQIERTDKIVQSLWKQAPTHQNERQWLDLNQLIAEISKLIYFSYKFEGIQVNSHFDESIGKIFLFSDIYQALINLIDNAFYTLQQKKKKLGEAFCPTLTLITKNLENAVEIVVQDNGEGISEAIQSRIFEWFVTTKPPGEGAGLGLTIVKEIVDKHRGELRLETEEQEFTKFIIKLPLFQPSFAAELEN